MRLTKRELGLTVYAIREAIQSESDLINAYKSCRDDEGKFVRQRASRLLKRLSKLEAKVSQQWRKQ